MKSFFVFWTLLALAAPGFGAGCPGDPDSRRSAAAKAETEALITQWINRDGEHSFLTSDRLALSLVANPSEFLAVWIDHPEEFTDWLDHLGGLSFSEFGDHLIDRGRLREAMIRSISELQPTEQRMVEAQDLLLKRLHVKKVRTVE